MDRKTKVPITRMNMWFDDMDFDLDLGIAQEFLENDSNFRVVLFRVDRVNTNHDDVYGESDVHEMRFLPPVELTVYNLAIGQSEMKSYVSGNGSLSYVDRGNLTFSVLTTMLKAQNVDFQRGDFFGYSHDESGLHYYTVANDGRMNMDSAHTLYGTKPYYRSVVCVPADPNQFNGL